MPMSCRRDLRREFIESLERRTLLGGDPLPVAVEETAYRTYSLTADPQRNLVYAVVPDPMRIIAFDTDRARVVSVAKVPGDAANSVCTSVDGSRLFVAQQYLKKIQILSLPSLTHIGTLETDQGYFLQAAGAQNRLYAVTADFTGLYQLDANTGATLRQLPSGSISMGADGKRFAWSDGAKISIYDSSTGGVPTLISTHDDLPFNLGRMTFDAPRNRTYHLGNYVQGVYVVDLNTDARTTWSFPDQLEHGGDRIVSRPDVGDLFTVNSGGTLDWNQFRVEDGAWIASQWTSSEVLFNFDVAMTKNGRMVFSGGDSHSQHYSLGIIGASSISANSLPPTARIQTNAYSSMKRQFDANLSDPGNTGLTFAKALWRFGDGTHAYGMQVDHAYTVPGDYKVRLTVTNSGGATHDAFVTIRAGDTTRTASISGTIFADTNSNGLRDSSKEKAFKDAAVWWDVNDDGQISNGETYTFADSSGRFKLLNLVGGGPHKLRATSYPFVMTIAPKIKLAPGAEVRNVNVALEKGGVISSYVFNDINRDGRKDSYENGVARQVWIDSDGDGVRDSNERSTSSNAEGVFSFDALSTGTYRLRVEAAAGDTQIVPAPGRSVDVSVKTWQKTRSDFAIRLQPNSTITGIVYNDENGNNTRDTGEQPRIKQTVFLDYNFNGKLDAGEDSTRTNGIGKYTLSAYAAPPGSLSGGLSSYYAVTAVLPAGWRHSVHYPASANPNATTVADLPVTQTARLSGRIFTDRNRNGRRDDFESDSIATTIFLDLNRNGSIDDDEPQTTATDYWELRESLTPGQYVLRVVTINSFVVTVPTGGVLQLTLRAGEERTLEIGKLYRP